MIECLDTIAVGANTNQVQFLDIWSNGAVTLRDQTNKNRTVTIPIASVPQLLKALTRADTRQKSLRAYA